MIEIKDLKKTFNKGSVNEVFALRGINLKIEKGDFVTIIGTNGSGKSTLLNAIAGSFLPDEGSIKINGKNVTRLRDYRRAKLISRVFQNPFQGTAPNMSIAENLHMAWLRGQARLPLIKLGKNRLNDFAHRVKALEMQLEGRLSNLIGSLSGGQRQALTLLMSVIREPKVLLLDEHTAALDPKSAAQVIRLTKRFVEEYGLTAIMVTHSMKQALELGNRTIMMNKGQIIDDINSEQKKKLNVGDLLDKFADLRRREMLTADLIEDLKNNYA